MKLTAFTDYALRVLMYLAARPDSRATIVEIAQAFDIKENHLTKVVHFLGKAGWITTTRGKGGGLRLARPPREIVVGDVVRETEGAAMPAECFSESGGNCCISPVCRLAGVLQEAVDAFYLALDGYTLQDVTGNRDELAKLLFVRMPGRGSGRARVTPPM
jgi:Rrf2 family transcriptional regulator, nitric oxide-sensitive transcriptional repressor